VLPRQDVGGQGLGRQWLVTSGKWLAGPLCNGRGSRGGRPSRKKMPFFCRLETGFVLRARKLRRFLIGRMVGMPPFASSVCSIRLLPRLPSRKLRMRVYHRYTVFASTFLCVNLEALRLGARRQRGKEARNKSGYERTNFAQNWRVWRHKISLRVRIWRNWHHEKGC